MSRADDLNDLIQESRQHQRPITIEDAVAKAEKLAAVDGTVTNSQTGEPMARTHVMLRAYVDGQARLYGAQHCIHFSGTHHVLQNRVVMPATGVRLCSDMTRHEMHNDVLGKGELYRLRGLACDSLVLPVFCCNGKHTLKHGAVRRARKFHTCDVCQGFIVVKSHVRVSFDIPDYTAHLQSGDALIDGAGVAPGHVVMDAATGTGEPGLSAARRVGSNGRVEAFDVEMDNSSSELIDYFLKKRGDVRR